MSGPGVSLTPEQIDSIILSQFRPPMESYSSKVVHPVFSYVPTWGDPSQNQQEFANFFKRCFEMDQNYCTSNLKQDSVILVALIRLLEVWFRQLRQAVNTYLGNSPDRSKGLDERLIEATKVLIDKHIMFSGMEGFDSKREADSKRLLPEKERHMIDRAGMKQQFQCDDYWIRHLQLSKKPRYSKNSKASTQQLTKGSKKAR